MLPQRWIVERNYTRPMGQLIRRSTSGMTSVDATLKYSWSPKLSFDVAHTIKCLWERLVEDWTIRLVLLVIGKRWTTENLTWPLPACIVAHLYGQARLHKTCPHRL